MKSENEILSKFSIADKAVLITGGGAGIGRGMALTFAGVGARVAISDKVSQNLEATAEEIRNLGGTVLPIEADVTRREQVQAMADKTVGAFGRIDVLVNNVGGGAGRYRAPISEFSDEKWDSIIRQNLKCTYLCAQIIGRIMMEQQQGNIINIVSVSALRPTPNLAPYGAVKAGIINFTQTLSVEYAPYNIRVNSIAPGSIDTPGTSYFGDRKKRSQLTGTPLGRPGVPEDIALGALYLASDASDYVTGINLSVDGGPFMGMRMLEMAQQVQKRVMG